MKRFKIIQDVNPSEQDVYETPDEDVKTTGALNPSEEKIINTDDIVLENISVKSSSTKFKDTLLESAGGDFSDVLSARRKQMYKSVLKKIHPTDLPLTAENELEVWRNNGEFKETPLQKLRRLLYETAELEQELASSTEYDGNNDRVTKDDLLKHVANLDQNLKSLQDIVTKAEDPTKGIDLDKNTLLERISQFKNADQKSIAASDGKENDVSVYELYATALNMAQQEKEVELNKRITKLEKIIGFNEEGQNLYEMLQRLEKDVAVLADGDQLDALALKCQKTNSELDSLISSVKQGKISELDVDLKRKISSLYAVTEQSEKLLKLLPVVCERLTSLKGLHNEAATFSSTLKSVSDEQVKISESLKLSQDIAAKLIKNMEKNENIMVANVEKMKL